MPRRADKSKTHVRSHVLFVLGFVDIDAIIYFVVMTERDRLCSLIEKLNGELTEIEPGVVYETSPKILVCLHH
jgi:hypothetical protein